MAGHLEVFQHHQDTVSSASLVIEVVDEDCLATCDPVLSPLTIISPVLFIPKTHLFELVESLGGEARLPGDNNSGRFETPGMPDPFDRLGPEKPLLP